MYIFSIFVFKPAREFQECLAQAHILTVPDHGLEKEAVTDLKHAVRYLFGGYVIY